MTRYTQSWEGLNLPFQEEVALISTAISAPVRKLSSKSLQAFQVADYVTSCLCVLAAAGYIALIAVFIWCIAPVLKAFLVAKCGVSPLIAKGACMMLKRAFSWGFGRIVSAIVR